MDEYLTNAGIEESMVTEPSPIGTSLVSVVNSLDPPPSFAFPNLSRLYQVPLPNFEPGQFFSTSEFEDRLEKEYASLAENLSHANYEEEAEESKPATRRMWRLQELAKRLRETTGVDWIGIFRVADLRNGAKVLVKEAYTGSPSRAVFPLNMEWTQKSNVTWVGFTGKAKIIQDVTIYAGPYYNCSSKVMSELCAPIFCEQPDILAGILVAESYQKNFFTPERCYHHLKVCEELSYSCLMRCDCE